jgi:predicted secreted protein with PEFG-CTERM motif
MNKFNFLFIITALLLIPFFDHAYATIYDINMPTGSASPDAPYFWQNEKTGEATGDIEILVGDTVIWKNGDGAKHTITSGTLDDGPDGIFGGTDFIVPGDFYTFTFTEKGQFPYFCLIHPWMTGIVTVTDEGYKIVADVGKDAGDGLTSFDIEYRYSGILSDATTNEKQKSITFQITSDTKSIDHHLKILFPPELIEGPYAIFIDGKKNLNFEYIPDDLRMIEIELSDDSKEITFIGTKIVPEFGVLSLIILGIAITSLVFVQKSNITLKF